MPVAVFAVGCGLGTESYNHNTMLNMVVVTIGVAIASYGEINFVVLGVLLQLAAVLTESSRLTLVRPLSPPTSPCWPKGVLRPNIRADTQAEHRARQDAVPG